MEGPLHSLVALLPHRRTHVTWLQQIQDITQVGATQGQLQKLLLNVQSPVPLVTAAVQWLRAARIPVPLRSLAAPWIPHVICPVLRQGT
jgi:hypothetical protein